MVSSPAIIAGTGPAAGRVRSPPLNGIFVEPGAVALSYAVAHVSCCAAGALLYVANAADRAGSLLACAASGSSTNSFAESTGWVIPNSFCQLTGPTCWTEPVPLL